MCENKKRIKYLCLQRVIAIACIAVVLFCNLPHLTLAVPTSYVKSEEEFYHAISEQILAGKKKASYSTMSNLFFYKMEDILNGYQRYFCEEEPLKSGQYLICYLDDFSCTYWKQGTEYIIEVNVSFKVKNEDLLAYFDEMQQVANELKGDSDYESIKAVHDYIIKEVDYDQSLTKYLDYEGFQSGEMVCNGYCLATFLLLSDMGIPVRIVTGEGYTKRNESERHAWNLVQLDGSWYNFDATWDDIGIRGVRYDYFLKNNEEFKDHVSDEYYQKKYEMMVSYSSYEMPSKDRFAIVMKKILVEYPTTIIFTIVITIDVIAIVIKRRRLAKQNMEVRYIDDDEDW